MMEGDGGSFSGEVRRGLLLKEQGRYSDAAKYFRDALAQNPHNAVAYHHLAVCQLQMPDRAAEALETIGQALAIEPNESSHHAVKAYILCSLRRPAQALEAAQAAIEVDPTASFSFTAEAQALLMLERWPEAERSARQALSLDADNATAANQLSRALQLQNKMAENAEQIAGMLARDPENAYTHASAGWGALRAGQRRVAEGHFLESLRLDPECESAREGLLQSFRARSPIYRAYLNYCFAMQRLGKGTRWAVILGLYFGARFSRVLFTGRYAPIGLGIGLLYSLFVLWVWVARGVGNFILLFDRFAKHALRKSEKLEGLFVGGGLLLGLTAAGVGALAGSEFLILSGVLFCASAIPFGVTFTNNAPVGKYLFGTVGALVLACAFWQLLAVAGVIPGIYARAVFLPALIGAFGVTWLGNLPYLRRL